jgi:hypothetical protein
MQALATDTEQKIYAGQWLLNIHTLELLDSYNFLVVVIMKTSTLLSLLLGAEATALPSLKIGEFIELLLLLWLT